MFTLLPSFEEYYHLRNNSFGGVKEVNGDEYGKECRINCQTESKIPAADKIRSKKMKPCNEKNFIPRTLGNKSN